MKAVKQEGAALSEISFLYRQKYKTKLKELSLPPYSFNVSGLPGKETIFDRIRKKHVRLTPEEWVRQHFVMYLVNHGKYPAGLIGVEVAFKMNGLKKRADIVVHDRTGRPLLIVECKAPEVNLDEKVFDQVVVYNMQFTVPFVVLTNGIVNYACRIDSVNRKYDILDYIPSYEELLNLPE